MTYKYRKMTTIILSSFLLFSQAACGSKTSPGEQPGPNEQPAEKPAEKTAETYQGYVYTTPEQLKTDLKDAAKEALSGLDAKKADIIGSFGSSMEEYRENYRKVTDWYDEEIMVSVQLYEKCESILRAVYSSIAGTAKKAVSSPRICMTHTQHSAMFLTIIIMISLIPMRKSLRLCRTRRINF